MTTRRAAFAKGSQGCPVLTSRHGEASPGVVPRPWRNSASVQVLTGQQEREAAMRTVFIAMAAAVLGLIVNATSSRAEITYPWCAHTAARMAAATIAVSSPWSNAA